MSQMPMVNAMTTCAPRLPKVAMRHDPASAACLREAAELLRPGLAKTIRLMTDLPAAPLLAEADPTPSTCWSPILTCP